MKTTRLFIIVSVLLAFVTPRVALAQLEQVPLVPAEVIESLDEESGAIFVEDDSNRAVRAEFPVGDTSVAIEFHHADPGSKIYTVEQGRFDHVFSVGDTTLAISSRYIDYIHADWSDRSLVARVSGPFFETRLSNLNQKLAKFPDSPPITVTMREEYVAKVLKQHPIQVWRISVNGVPIVLHYGYYSVSNAHQIHREFRRWALYRVEIPGWLIDFNYRGAVAAIYQGDYSADDNYIPFDREFYGNWLIAENSSTLTEANVGLPDHMRFHSNEEIWFTRHEHPLKVSQFTKYESGLISDSCFQAIQFDYLGFTLQLITDVSDEDYLTRYKLFHNGLAIQANAYPQLDRRLKQAFLDNILFRNEDLGAGGPHNSGTKSVGPQSIGFLDFYILVQYSWNSGYPVAYIDILNYDTTLSAAEMQHQGIPGTRIHVTPGDRCQLEFDRAESVVVRPIND